MFKSKMDKGTVKFILSEINYQNLYILPPFLDSNEIKFFVGYQEERIILTIKKVTNGTFTMNNSLGYGVTYSSEKDPISQEIPPNLISQFLTRDLSCFMSSDHISNNNEHMNVDTNLPRGDNKDKITNPENDNNNNNPDSIIDDTCSIKNEDVVVDPINNTITSTTIQTSADFLILKEQNEELINQLLQLPQPETSYICKWKKDITSEGMYIGESNFSGSYHGRGAFVYNDGCLYIGNWCFGEKEGMGIQYYSKEEKYIGEFYTNHRHGKGKLFLGNGIFYEGKFCFDKMSGQGVFIYPGNLKVNVIHNKGQLI